MTGRGTDGQTENSDFIGPSVLRGSKKLQMFAKPKIAKPKRNYDIFKTTHSNFK